MPCGLARAGESRYQGPDPIPPGATVRWGPIWKDESCWIDAALVLLRASDDIAAAALENLQEMDLELYDNPARLLGRALLDVLAEPWTYTTREQLSAKRDILRALYEKYYNKRPNRQGAGVVFLDRMLRLSMASIPTFQYMFRCNKPGCSDHPAGLTNGSLRLLQLSREVPVEEALALCFRTPDEQARTHLCPQCGDQSCVKMFSFVEKLPHAFIAEDITWRGIDKQQPFMPTLYRMGRKGEAKGRRVIPRYWVQGILILNESHFYALVWEKSTTTWTCLTEPITAAKGPRTAGMGKISNLTELSANAFDRWVLLNPKAKISVLYSQEKDEA